MKAVFADTSFYLAVLNPRDLGLAALIALAVFGSGLMFFSRAAADAGDKV